MKRIGILLILCVLAAQPTRAEPRGADETISSNIPGFVQRLDSLRRVAHIPGLSVAVVRNEQILLAAGLGYANLENRVPATAETPYNIGSVTKPISAVVLLRLVEEGKLDLDRPMVEYSRWADFCADFRQTPSIFARELRCDPPVHTLRHMFSHTATGEPGTHFSYNPVLYSWASRPIMAATESSFSDLVAQYVFEPADMKRSARAHRDLPLREDLAEQLAPPYRLDSLGTLERSPELPPQGDGAAGGVRASVLDLAKFDIALDRGVLISEESRAEMMTPTRSLTGKPLPYGLGWYVQDYGGQTLVWHSGWWPEAYSALYLKVPERRLTFIILANSEGVWWNNPLDRAEVERSEFAQLFLRAFAAD